MRRSRSGSRISATIKDVPDHRGPCRSRAHAIKADDPLITLESDKATMEVSVAQRPDGHRRSRSRSATRCSAGTLIADAAHRRPTSSRRRMAAARHRRRPHRPAASRQSPARAISTPRCWCSAPVQAATPPRSGPPISARRSCWSTGPTLGGVCLNVGCIPSKALLHAAKVIDETREMADHGITSRRPRSTSTSCAAGRTASSRS